MQGLELILLSIVILVGVAYIASQLSRRGSTDHLLGRLLLGVVPAVIGVLLVVIARLDVIPDDLEQPLSIVAVVMVSAALLVGTTYRLAGR